jgi:molecular chaperone IbpA
MLLKEDMIMRTSDFAPLYRSTVGFDRLFDLLDQSERAEAAPNWPPYNIERVSDDDYRITMALAGFSPEEIELVQKEGTLFVAGHRNAENGLLTVELKREVPEALKPRRIEIATGLAKPSVANVTTLEQSKAA